MAGWRGAGKLVAGRSVSGKLLLPILLSVGFGLTLLTGFISRESAGIVDALARTDGDEMAQNIAGKVEIDLTRPLQIARTLRDTFVRMQVSGIQDRGVYLALLRDVLAANHDYVGGWTIWDADGFGAMLPDASRSIQGSNPTAVSVRMP